MTHTARRIRAAAGALVVTLALALGLVVLQPTAAHAAETDTIYSLVNEARWSQGSAGLVRNSAMDTVAAGWAAQLAQAGTLSHNPSYSSQIPGGWTAAAENVAQGYAGGAAMQNGWMNSPGHRTNILGNFTDIGIAYLESGGTTWGVQVFANYPGSVGPAAPVAAPVAPAPVEPAPAEPAPVAEAPAATPTPEPTAADPSATATANEEPGAANTRAKTATPAPNLENSRSASSAALADDSGSPSSPLWAAALGLAVVIAGVLLSQMLRTRRASRARHAL
ncbi:CAP domain-containing protein [Salinibacterium sp. G-O1]|uniref:CAP domain-containing protein n=1 Tax=Salinibacterium sp. G-O1 TaxID=3046208 RepID=UPI0024BA209F|nr:CAP domain-containing protein [Salinibacterium sp. G-O1]MDJ0335639.1 CAP domain-containing protein [Salinibacterium sp. G-O1]